MAHKVVEWFFKPFLAWISMKSNVKKILSWLVLVALIGLFGYYVYNNMGHFTALKIGNPWLLVPLVLISLIATALGGLTTKFVLQPFGINLKFKEWFGLVC